MTTSIVQNKTGSFTVYVGGRKTWSGELAALLVHLGQAPAPAPRRAKKQKPLSRSARWEDACGRAQSALEELVEIQQEFSEWKDNLESRFEGSALVEKLEAVTDSLELQSALDTVEEAQNADLPLGFGRD